jgi:hypothetical protein
VADPRDLDEAIAAVFKARFGGGVRTANERAAEEHLRRRFTSGPELSTRLWGEGVSERESIIDYLRSQFRTGQGFGETPGFPKNRVLSNLRAWYEQGPSEGLLGDPTYVARRLAVTESAFYTQALDNAVDQELEQAGLIDGYEILLAPERKDWGCKCPEHAANGPYPTLEETPEPPFHPLCQCRRRPIILGEKSRKKDEEAGRQLIASFGKAVALSVADDIAIYAVSFAVRQIAMLRALSDSDAGQLLQEMQRQLLRHYILLGRERVRRLFRKANVITVEPELVGKSVGNAETLLQLATKNAARFPELPAPAKVTKGATFDRDEIFDAKVRDLLKDAMRKAERYDGHVVFRPPRGAAVKEWATDDVIRSLFEFPGQSIKISADDLTVWKKGGELDPATLARITARPAPTPGAPPPPEWVAAARPGRAPLPAVFRVWPVSAVEARTLGGAGDEVVLAPGAVLRPFAVSEEGGELVIDFREMPSWSQPQSYPDSEITRFADPLSSQPPQAIVDTWRRLFPLPPAQLLAHLSFGLDVKLDKFAISMTIPGEIRVDIGTDLFTARRRFRETDLGVEVAHSDFRVTTAAQGQGVGRVFTANSVYLYEALGFRRAVTYASGQRGDVGAYTWARFGFTPTPVDWGMIRRANLLPWIERNAHRLDPADVAELRNLASITNPRAIWAIADHPIGRDMLTTSNVGWQGVLDLTDEEAMRRFNAYTRRLPLVVQRAEQEELALGLNSLADPEPPLDPRQIIERDLLALMAEPLRSISAGVPDDMIDVWQEVFSAGESPADFVRQIELELQSAASRASLGPLYGETVFVSTGEDAQRRAFVEFAIRNQSGDRFAHVLVRPGPLGSRSATIDLLPDTFGRHDYGVVFDKLTRAIAATPTFAALGEEKRLFAYQVRDAISVVDAVRAGMQLPNGGDTLIAWRNYAREVLENPDERIELRRLAAAVLESQGDDYVWAEFFHDYDLGRAVSSVTYSVPVPTLHNGRQRFELRLPPPRVAGDAVGAYARTRIELSSLPQGAGTSEQNARRIALINELATGRSRAAGLASEAFRRYEEAKAASAAPAPAPAPAPARRLRSGEVEQGVLPLEGVEAAVAGRPDASALDRQRSAWVAGGATKDGFKQAFGYDPTDALVAVWNDRMPLAPGQLVDYLYSFAPPELVGEYSWSWNHSGDTLRFSLSTAGGPTGVKIAGLDRSFYDGEVKHSFFKVQRSGDAGRGLGKAMLSAFLDVYEAMGILRVEVSAGLDAGGYTWAKFGFLPDDDITDLANGFLNFLGADWDSYAESVISGSEADLRTDLREELLDDRYQQLLDDALAAGDAELSATVTRELDDEVEDALAERLQDELDTLRRDYDAKRAYLEEFAEDEGIFLDDDTLLWQIADHPKGKRYLAGQSWSGYLDLENAEQMARFDAYVGRGNPIESLLDEAEAIAAPSAPTYRLGSPLRGALDMEEAAELIEPVEPIVGTPRTILPAVPRPADIPQAEFLRALSYTDPGQNLATRAAEAATAVRVAATVFDASLLDLADAVFNLPGLPAPVALTLQPAAVSGRVPTDALPASLTISAESTLPPIDIAFSDLIRTASVGLQLVDAGIEMFDALTTDRYRTPRIANIGVTGSADIGMTPTRALESFGHLFRIADGLVGEAGVVRMFQKPGLYYGTSVSDVDDSPARGIDAGLGTIFDFASLEIANRERADDVYRALQLVIAKLRLSELPELDRGPIATREARERQTRAYINTIDYAPPSGESNRVSQARSASQAFVDLARRSGHYELLGFFLRNVRETERIELTVDRTLARQRFGAPIPVARSGRAHLKPATPLEEAIADQTAALLNLPPQRINRAWLNAQREVPVSSQRSSLLAKVDPQLWEAAEELFDDRGGGSTTYLQRQTGNPLVAALPPREQLKVGISRIEGTPEELSVTVLLTPDGANRIDFLSRPREPQPHQQLQTRVEIAALRSASPTGARLGMTMLANALDARWTPSRSPFEFTVGNALSFELAIAAGANVGSLTDLATGVSTEAAVMDRIHRAIRARAERLLAAPDVPANVADAAREILQDPDLGGSSSRYLNLRQELIFTTNRPVVRSIMLSGIQDALAEGPVAMKTAGGLPSMSSLYDAFNVLESSLRRAASGQMAAIDHGEPGAMPVRIEAFGDDQVRWPSFAPDDDLIIGADARPVAELFPAGDPAAASVGLPSVRGSATLISTDELGLRGMDQFIDIAQGELGVPIVGIRGLASFANMGEVVDAIERRYGAGVLGAFNESQQRNLRGTPLRVTAQATYWAPLSLTEAPTAGRAFSGFITINLDLTEGLVGNSAVPWAPALVTSYDEAGPPREALPGRSSPRPVGRWLMSNSFPGLALHEIAHAFTMPSVAYGYGLLIGRAAPTTDADAVRLATLVDRLRRYMQDGYFDIAQARKAFPSDYAYDTFAAYQQLGRGEVEAIGELIAEATTGLALDRERFRMDYPRLAAMVEELLPLTLRMQGASSTLALPEPTAVLGANQGGDYPPSPGATTRPAELPAPVNSGTAADMALDARTGLDFERFFSKLAGQFGQHIDQSIPNYAPNRAASAEAIANTLAQGDLVIDVGASEGQFGQSIGLATGGAVRVRNVDPNPNMRRAWEERGIAPGNEYEVAALVEGFRDDENGIDVPAFVPRGDAAVVHMSMVRQFVTDDADTWYGEVRRMLRPDGVFVNNVKVVRSADDTGEWSQRESQKDDYKRLSFTQTEITQKAEETLVGMHQLMLTKEQELAALRAHFKHVAVYWQSYNFYGYAASDDADALARFVAEHARLYRPTYQPFVPKSDPLGLDRQTDPDELDAPPLYHGTDLASAMKIGRDGQLTPRVGETVRYMYEEYPGQGDGLPELIFFGDQRSLPRVISFAIGMAQQAARDAGASGALTPAGDVTLEAVRRYGAIIEARDYDPDATYRLIQGEDQGRSLADPERTDSAPPQVEPRDIYSYEAVPAADVYTGQRLLDFIRQAMLDSTPAAWDEMAFFEFADLRDLGFLGDAPLALDARRDRATSVADAAIERVLAYVEREGGATYSLRYDRFHEGSGHAVAYPPSYAVKIERRPTLADVRGLVGAHPELFARDDVYVGFWLDDKTGIWYLEPSQVIADFDEAVRVAIERNQIAIWSFERKQLVETGGTGELLGMDLRLDTGGRPLVSFPVELLMRRRVVAPPPAPADDQLQVAYFAPDDRFVSIDPLRAAWEEVDDELASRVFADGRHQPGLVPAARAVVVGGDHEVRIAPGRLAYAYVATVPRARLWNAQVPYVSEVDLVTRGYLGLYWPTDVRDPRRGQVRLFADTPARYVGKLDWKTGDATGDSLWAHVLDTNGPSSRRRSPRIVDITWTDAGWAAEGFEAEVNQAMAAGHATILATVAAPPERIRAALDFVARDDDPHGPMADLPVGALIARELRQDAAAHEAAVATRRRAGADEAELAALMTTEAKQAFVVERAIARAPMSPERGFNRPPQSFGANPLGPGAYTTSVREGARVAKLGELRAFDPRVLPYIEPGLAGFYSPQYLALRLGYQAVDMGMGYAVLNAAAEPEEPQSSAVISGPTRAVERIRKDNPDVEFRYLTYVPLNREE